MNIQIRIKVQLGFLSCLLVFTIHVELQNDNNGRFIPIYTSEMLKNQHFIEADSDRGRKNVSQMSPLIMSTW